MGSIKDWLAGRLTTGKIKLSRIEEDEACWLDYAGELKIREFAFWSCVNLIANAVSKCEFQTFFGGEEIKGKEYYLWNIEPNKTQSKSEFIHQLIGQLYSNNEALVIEQGGGLFVADSFSRETVSLQEDVFSGIQVRGIAVSGSFSQSEVLYFPLSGQKFQPLLNGFSRTYQKLIQCSVQSYQKSRGMKGILELDTTASGSKEFQERYAALRNKEFRSWAQAENGVLPLYRGMKFTELGSKTYSSEGTRDIRAMVDDIVDFTASALSIPAALISKQVEGTEEAVSQFLTFCIDPLVELLQGESNRKRSGYAGFRNGTYLKIDTKTIRHIDLFSIASAVDKLIASGFTSINELREAAGYTRINEEWADKHFLTKNYDQVENLEGGEIQQND